MRTRTTSRSMSPAAVLAAAVAPLAVVASASAATTYSTTPTTVYTAASAGYSTLTVGIGGTAASSSPAALIDQDPSVVAGLESPNTTIYYLTPGTTAGTSTVTTVALSDAAHVGSPALIQVSSSGVVYGTQNRTGSGGQDANGDPLSNSDVFTYTPTSPTAGTYNLATVPTVLGSGTGANYAPYTYTLTSGTTSTTAHQFSAVTPSISNTGNQIGTDGSVAGTITEFVGDANSMPDDLAPEGLGSDGFYLSPGGKTTAIGFSGAIGTTGETYDQAQDGSVPSLLSHTTSVIGMAGTAAVGYTARYATVTSGSPNGQDAFSYTPANGMAQIGLVGGIYTKTSLAESSTPTQTNTAGQIAGTSVVENSTSSYSGTDAWLYTPSTTTPGTATTYGTSSAGTYVRLGLLATPTATQVGNISPTSGTHTSTVAFLEPNGTAAGTSGRYDTSGTSRGNAAYYFNGTSNVDISPVDAIHPVTPGATFASSDTITAMNNAGQVAATAGRYSSTGVSLGRDAYVYDASAGKDFFVDPTDESSTTGYEISSVGAISSTGEAVGYYETFSGATAGTLTGGELFVWNETTGLEGLMSFTAAQAPSLASYVDSFTFGPDGTLYGPNAFATGTSTNVENAVIAYTAVPEPASAGLLAVLAGGTLARRRRRTA